MNMRQQKTYNRQRGAVMVIGMIMLLMITLIAVAAIRLTTNHTQITNNEQVRTEANTAANYALDMFLNQPVTQWDVYQAAGTTSMVNLGTSKAVDSDAVSMQVTVNNLTCKRGRVIKNSELYKKTPAGVYYVANSDSSCFGGGSGAGFTVVDTGSSGASSGNSLCATVLYEVQATANDSKLLNATPPTVAQGVEVRTDITSLADSCK
jgi:hypothetical protein